MTNWPSATARRVLAALQTIGWQIKRQTGSHQTLTREGYPDFVFTFHVGTRLAPRCWQGLQSTPVSTQRTYRDSW
jgi:predicted RNA binding protein YcfA (HicA-like mRNA interferase family)